MQLDHAEHIATIDILTTGGTFDTLPDGSIGPPQAAMLLGHARVTLCAACCELMRMDSSAMQDSHRRAIRAAVLQAGHRIVIIHGTDTLLQTAAALEGIPGKVMVLTGSFIPADQPQGDAAFNLGAAMLAVQLLPPGIHVVIGGEHFHPAAIRKDPVARRFKRI
jgi:L-asparaginase